MNKVINMSKWIALMGAIICLGCAKEDFSSLPQSEIFIKYYGSAKEDVVIDVLKLSQDNPLTPDIDEDRYLILGTRASKEEGENDMLLMMTDSAGNRKWEMPYSFNVKDSEGNIIERGEEVPSSIYISADNSSGWVIGTAFYDTPNESIFLLNFELETGTVISDIVFQYFDNRGDSPESLPHAYVKSRGADILEVDGSILILGSVETGVDERSEANKYCIFLTRIGYQIDAGTGEFELTNTHWSQFDGFNSGEDLGVKLLYDGNQYFYIASSEIQELSANKDVMIKWFDPLNGNELSDVLRIGSDGNETPTNVIADDFNLYVTGSSGANQKERAFFIRIGKELQDGDGIFTRVQLDPEDENSSITSSDEGHKGQDLVKLPDGNYYIIGTLKNYTNDENVLKQDEIVLMKVNGDGELIDDATQIYGSDEDDSGNAIWLNSDESLILGATMGFGGDAKMMTLIKTNSKGALRR